MFVNLCKKANVKHPVLDYGLSPQAEDKDIYNLAIKHDFFVVTINYKHFKRLVLKNKPGVIAIPAELSNEKIDSLLSQFVSENDPDELWGRSIRIPAPWV